MFQVPLATSASFFTREQFWKAVSIYHERPHIVNRKVAVADQILNYKISVKDEDSLVIYDSLTAHALSYEIKKLSKIDRTGINLDFLLNLLEPYLHNVELSVEDVEVMNLSENGIFISVRIILPRMQKCSRCIELVILDKDKDMATFISMHTDKDKINPLPSFPYRVELSRENFMRITLKDFEDADTSCAEWLFDSLFKKLVNWTELGDAPENTGSLRHIPLAKYCELYNDLKVKYGEPLRKVWWEKTKTDPQKFIYEDIAIASYLICFWTEEYKTEATSFVEFVDCGCGNGLLVYILNREGFKGLGIDLRRRNVWDLYEGAANLQVATVSPNSEFPNANWLIGNHSDELTPWIPVIASKSSLLTNFFVLPCCPYDFNGKKYIRKNTSMSQYSEYMEYIKEVSAKCEFEVSVDKLRIPSTKRTCILGVRRKNLQNIPNLRERIDSFLKSKLDTDGFKARPSIEKVRNCTQIDNKIRERIIIDVVGCLLNTLNLIERQDGRKWNKGGAVLISKLSELLKKDYLTHLKKECGGLQTLLRNHRYIFQIEKAYVTLRLPYKIEETSKYKEKPCWYFKFHPDGCLFSDQTCGYMHNK